MLYVEVQRVESVSGRVEQLVHRRCLAETAWGNQDEVVVLEAEIAEIQEKGLVPLGETSNITPFGTTTGDDYKPGQRGFRALAMVGQLDTDIAGLRPVDERYRIAGASSDITVVNLGDNPAGLKVGDSLRFHLNYSALLRLMSGKYFAQQVRPSLEQFDASFTGTEDTEVVPVLRQVDVPGSE